MRDRGGYRIRTGCANGAESHPSQTARRMGTPHGSYKSGFHAEASKLVTPKDKSGHAEDHGVAG
jgi:hypothetical protein